MSPRGDLKGKIVKKKKREKKRIRDRIFVNIFTISSIINYFSPHLVNIFRET